MNKITLGAYVLATKFSDGDRSDPWIVGFYHGKTEHGRHLVVDSLGIAIRPSGYRRCETITAAIGAYLCDQKNDSSIERLWSTVKRIRLENH